MIVDGKLTASDPFVCDLMHSPINSNDIGIHVMPTLTCKQTRFSVQRNRCLICDELLAAQGIATPKLMEALGEDGESIVAFKRICGNMSERFKRNAAGNGMHLHAICAVIAWSRANAEPENAIRPPILPRDRSHPVSRIPVDPLTLHPAACSAALPPRG